MPGEIALDKLLRKIDPKLLPGEYVFCSVPSKGFKAIAELNPLASYQEEEGLSLLLPIEQADKANLEYSIILRGITLSVHSSLEAVGFTAAVTRRLAEEGISANVIAAHYHDHIFVPTNDATLALKLLVEY